MNATQIKYTRQRIEEIAGEKQRAIREKYPIRRIDASDYYKAIKEGTVVLKDAVPHKYGSTCITTFFEFPKFNDGSEAQLAALEELRKYKSRALDQLLLGELQEALNVLNNFSNTEF